MDFKDFNVGDRVQRIIGVDHSGKTGTVIRIDDFVYVRFDLDGHRFGSYPHNLIILEKEEYEVDE